jgi:hypothetical protein
MAYAFNRNERIYLQNEATYGIIPNTSGAATLTGANCCRHIKCVLTPKEDMLVREDKTGSRTTTPGTAGKRTGSTWSIEASMAASGTPGVAPDCDPALQSLFGSAPTIVPGVSVTYSISDAPKSFSLWDYRTPATVMQRVGSGCLSNEVTVQLGQGVAKINASGPCKWIVDSVNFSTLDSVGKSGLSAFPAEPALNTIVTNGGIIPAYKGVATWDSNVLATLRTSTLRMVANNFTVDDTFGSDYATTTEADVRDFSVDLNIYDDDGSTAADLYQKALSKTPITIVNQIGVVPGSIWTWTIKGVQLALPAIVEGQRRWTASFGASRASGSSLTALDEVSLTIS